MIGSEGWPGFLPVVGQEWGHILDLVVAFVLSWVIGLEREARRKPAGMRTYTLIGIGSALFVLLSKWGFSDVPGGNLDPSRVAAQIVSGLGFIGGGLIFVRRDSVRGLTTAASIWLTAAIGAASGAGLALLASVTVLLYFVVLYGLRPIGRRVRGMPATVQGLRITYLDGNGLLRDIVTRVTDQGFAVVQLNTTRRRVAASWMPNQDLAIEATITLSGSGEMGRLTTELGSTEGILSVRTESPSIE